MSDGAEEASRDPAAGSAAFDIDVSSLRSDRLKSGYTFWRSRCVGEVGMILVFVDFMRGTSLT